MMKFVLPLLTSSLVVAGFIMVTRPARSGPEPSAVRAASMLPATVIGPSTAPPAAFEPEGPPPDPRVEHLGAYLEGAAFKWMQLPDCDQSPRLCAVFRAQEHEDVVAVITRIHETSMQIAQALQSREPAWDKDKTKSLTGLVDESLAFHESRFRGYVDACKCNDPEWVRSPEGIALTKLGDCDGDKKHHVGKAYTMWQMHLEGESKEEIAKTCADRLIAAGKSIDRVTKGIRSGWGLRSYTGEWQPGGGPAPAAERRMKLAEDYARTHPYTE